MGKLKTRKTLIKRLKITSTGKLMRRNIQTGHLKVKLSSSVKNRKAQGSQVNVTFTKIFKAMLPKVRI